MPRIPKPWYQWHIAWPNVVWLTLWLFALTKIITHPIGALLTENPLGWAFALFIILVLIKANIQALWRNRYPFVFTVRGDREIKWRGHGRDEIYYVEGKRIANIYSGLAGGDIDRIVEGKSLKAWEPPYAEEPMSIDKKRNILVLLCEQYDYEGVRYKIYYDNTLQASLICPFCQYKAMQELSLELGDLTEINYTLGDRYDWGPPVLHVGRPTSGNATMTVDAHCNNCAHYYRVSVVIHNDIIESAHAVPGQQIPKKPTFWSILRNIFR